MTTDNGLIHPKSARACIDALQDRRQWLIAKISTSWIELGHGLGFLEEELKALDWALPILEAEWDELARLHRNTRHMRHFLKLQEERGTNHLKNAIAWELP